MAKGNKVYGKGAWDKEKEIKANFFVIPKPSFLKSSKKDKKK